MAGNISMMAAFADALHDEMENDARIRVMTADLVGSCGLKTIEKDYGEQFINVGIAEQNMIGIAAGLAHEGMLPYAYTFAAFHSMRACEQIRTDVFYNELNVKIIGTHCGVSTGQAGSTHFALEDMGIIRAMPGSVVLSPSDPVSAAVTAGVVYDYPKGVYVRLDRNPLPSLYEEGETFAIGQAKILRDGSDVVLFAVGAAVHAALAAADLIQAIAGKSAAVIDIYSVKPLDVSCVLHYAQKCAFAFTVEEHNIYGGLFGAVAECIAQAEHRCVLKPIGIKNFFPHGNTVERARELLGLDAAGIAKTVCEVVR